MKLITERTRVRDVAKRWRAQYPKRSWKDDKDEIANQLEALDGETATEADVAAIIGNDDWCGPVMCNECGAGVSVAVIVGEKQDDESATAVLCLACLEKALDLLREHCAVEFNANTIAAYDSLDDEQKKNLAVKFIEYLKDAT